MKTLKAIVATGDRNYVVVLAQADQVQTIFCRLRDDRDITLIEYSPRFGMDNGIDLVALNNAVGAFDRAARSTDDV